MRVKVILEQDEDGMFIATCDSVPGCISQGATRKEALENIRDALKGYFSSLKAHGEPLPPPIVEEVVDIESKLPSTLY